MSTFWEWSKDVSFVNRFIFPAPKPPSYNKESFPDELLFVPPKEKLYAYYKQFKMRQYNKDNDKMNILSPKYNEEKQEYCDEDCIPCIYIERKYRLSEATHLLLYLHGNAEDLGKCYPIIDYIRMKLQCNILAPEYPGYGVSNGDANENSVAAMVQNVYEFAISPYGLNVPPSRIIIYGFSIGSAAALSSTWFDLNKVYIPNSFMEQSEENNKNEQKEKEMKNDKKNKNKNENDENKLLKYKQNEDKLKKKRTKYFFSTFLKKCPHKKREHNVLFGNDNDAYFYSSDFDTNEYGDPFERLPLASLLNILRKGNIQYPTSVNKKELLLVARKNGLIPPLNSCKKANVTRKYSLIIIVCPFASISQVVADKIGSFASYLLSDRFQNIEAVKKVHGPLLIIHGKEDSIIPYEHSIKLHKVAQKCDIQPVHMELLDGCDHNTMDLRKITNIINKFFKHQFNLCRSQKKMQMDADGNINNDNLTKQRNDGRNMNEFAITIPSYCWLKPETAAHELSEEDMQRLKKKQEQDDEEYAFNLFMKQLLQHESMQNASSSQLKSHQSEKLKKIFGDDLVIDTNKNEKNNVAKEEKENEKNQKKEEQNAADEYSISRAMKMRQDDIVLPPDSN